MKEKLEKAEDDLVIAEKDEKHWKRMYVPGAQGKLDRIVKIDHDERDHDHKIILTLMIMNKKKLRRSQWRLLRMRRQRYQKM